MKLFRVVVAAVAMAAHAAVYTAPAGAQRAVPRSARASVAPGAPSDSLVVSLLTFGPGAELFDRFGHTAIRVRNSSGLDSAWNWGMYDFNAPNFIGRFLTGDTQYWMAGYPTAAFVRFYREQGRAIWEQELEIDQAGADSLLKFMRWNARPENKFYRYDYYLDNCSTRARDALDLALHGALKREISAAIPDASISWRRETLRMASAFPLIGFGMTFALGRRADAGLTPWEEGFLPARLRDRIGAVRVGSNRRPLVRAERELNPPGPVVDAPAAPVYEGRAALIGAIVAVALLLIGVASSRTTGTAARRLLGAFGSVWHLVMGVAGLLVLVAGLFTKHAFMAENLSVLLGTPASLALVWYFPRALSPRATDRTQRAGVALSLFAAGCAAVAMFVRAVAPALAPADLAPGIFALPIHLFLVTILVQHQARRVPVTPA